MKQLLFHLTTHPTRAKNLITYANAFGVTKNVNIVFVPNQTDEISFALANLSASSNSKEYNTLKYLNKIINFGPKLKSILNNNDIIKNGESKFVLEIGTLKPTYKYFLKEKENSRLYLSVHEFDFVYGDASLSCETSFDCNKFIPAGVISAIKLVNYAASWVNSSADIKLEAIMKLSINASLEYDAQYAFDQGDGVLSTIPEENHKFVGKFGFCVELKPQASFNFDEYVAEISTPVNFCPNFPIEYNPQTGEINWKIETDPIKFVPTLELKNSQNNKVYYHGDCELILFDKRTWYDSSN